MAFRHQPKYSLHPRRYGRKSLTTRVETYAPRAAGDLTDPVLEPLQRPLGAISRSGGELALMRKPRNLPLPGPSHRALLDVDFELQVPRDKRADACHHSVPAVRWPC